MIAVIFEVEIKPGRQDAYLDIAGQLGPELETFDGFISIERFESLKNPGKLLSLSFWRDEDALQRWRNHGRHRKAQEEGRSRIFNDYRLRIAGVIRDYGMDRREEAPADSLRHHG